MGFFQDKVVAVTGAASGMGLATAKLLASRGAIVSLADINAAALQTATESLTGSDKHMSTVIDVRSSRSVDDWIASTVERLGRLDGAVNMAGIITPAKPVAEELLRHGERRGVLSCTGHNQNPFRLWPVHAKSLVDGRDVGLQFAVNTRGVFFCMRAEIKAMKAGGSIVSAASTFGQMGSPGVAPYCASKAAVIGLSRAAAKENSHIRINCVAPGSVDTPMSAGENPDDVKRGLQQTAQKRRAQPIEIANVIAFLLSDEASFVTGAVYNVDGGWLC